MARKPPADPSAAVDFEASLAELESGIAQDVAQAQAWLQARR